MSLNAFKEKSIREKPVRAPDAQERDLFLLKIVIKLAPMMAIAAMLSAFKRLKNIPSSLSPVRLVSQAVTQVPTFAPNITPMARLKESIPESARLTTVTEMAVELWRRAVTPVPKSRARRSFFVHFSRVFYNNPPEFFSKDDFISFIP